MLPLIVPSIVGIGMLIFLRRKGDVRLDDLAPAGAPVADVDDGRPLDDLPAPRWSDDGVPPDDAPQPLVPPAPPPNPGDGRAEPQ